MGIVEDAFKEADALDAFRAKCHEAHLHGELDDLRAENEALRKVYQSSCPECGYSGCVRGQKACDYEIDTLQAEVAALKKVEEAAKDCMGLSHIREGVRALGNALAELDKLRSTRS